MHHLTDLELSNLTAMMFVIGGITMLLLVEGGKKLVDLHFYLRRRRQESGTPATTSVRPGTPLLKERLTEFATRVGQEMKAQNERIARIEKTLNGFKIIDAAGIKRGHISFVEAQRGNPPA